MLHQRFLTDLRRLSGANTASLLVVSRDPDPRGTLLLHQGHMDPIPELASKDVAIAEVARRDRSSSPAAINFYESRVEGGYLLRISVALLELETLSSEYPVGEERRRQGPGAARLHSDDAVWFGLRYEGAPLPAHLELLRSSRPGTAGDADNWLNRSLIMGANLVWESSQLSRLLRDPTSQMPGRAEFQAQLKEAFYAANQLQQSLHLLLINPDDFGVINQHLDRESGDTALAEVASTLSSCLRRSDDVFRYGGAVFAVLMMGSEERAVEVVAEKILQALTGAYLDGAVRLNFSIGRAIHEPGNTDNPAVDELGLLRRADHALNLAKRNGGGCVIKWDGESANAPEAGRDRLSGIFTADAEKDYRNMLLLWDTIAIISSAEQESQIAAAFVERIDTALAPGRAALIAGSGEAARLLASVNPDSGPGDGETELSEHQRELLLEAEQTGETRSRSLTAGGDGEPTRVAYAAPLLAGERCIGCIYLEGPEGKFILDASDLVFLNALAGQVAIALDRVHLAARWREERDRESRKLREEVHELRQVVRSARLIYRSPQMSSLLETARSVAGTDVTILITGESGTGKEVLARAVHDMSDRQQQPLVTVDCGAIAHNLIETELFGHTRGAYTGADQSAEGRILQADGGTLFLDEIGEVPLDVQAKLLRFVQEKEYTPVGATQSRQVDVRIVAATNRDLTAEVAAGRFREDLFYRLNVVTLTTPPLRDRSDDILPLARHFLEKFALQYEKGLRRFSHDAERRMQAHNWPGNVRELQNSILRAVVLSSAEVIDADLLQFESAVDEPAHDLQIAAAPAPELADAATPRSGGPGGVDADPWQKLRGGLVQQLEAILDHNGTPLPLGKWLNEDLVLAADKQAAGVARRGAAKLGLAVTTYRRQLEKARQAEAQGLETRSRNWADTRARIEHLVRALPARAETSIVESSRALLLGELVSRLPEDDSRGAALMGVTLPTYRRWRERQPAQQ